MKKIERHYTPVENFAKKYDFSLDDVLHGAATGQLILSIYVNSEEIAYVKMVPVGDDYYSTLCERKHVSGFIDILPETAKKLHLNTRKVSPQLVSDLNGFPWREFTQNKKIDARSLFITKRNEEIFIDSHKHRNTPLGTASAEAKCGEWLEKWAALGKPPFTKKEMFQTALQEFAGLSLTGFRRIWERVIKKYPDWTRKGRPKKIIPNNHSA